MESWQARSRNGLRGGGWAFRSGESHESVRPLCRDTRRNSPGSGHAVGPWQPGKAGFVGAAIGDASRGDPTESAQHAWEGCGVSSGETEAKVF